jgi:hypothetical protein
MNFELITVILLLIVSLACFNMSHSEPTILIGSEMID